MKQQNIPAAYLYLIEGLKTSSIDDLIAHKESLNRPKDQKDLEVLYRFRLEEASS